MKTQGNNHYGVSSLNIENSNYQLEIFLYDTLDTVHQNIPIHGLYEGVPPLAVMNHHLFTSLRGVFLAQPGDQLHTKNGETILLFKHVVLLDRYFFTELERNEFDALVTREEVLYRHITKTGNDHALRHPREYYITHDTLTCQHGAKASDLKKALKKSKRFEYGVTARIFKMDAFDRVMLKLLYRLQGFNLHSRIRNKNLRMLQKRPPLSLVHNHAIHPHSRRA